MNPLLFADWNRMNRLFTRGMWIVAAILVGVVAVVLLSTGSAAHADQVGHTALGATGLR
jgi:hypothetical protein